MEDPPGLSTFEGLLHSTPALLTTLPEDAQYNVAATSWSALAAALRYAPIQLNVGREPGGLLQGIALRIEREERAQGTLRVTLDAERRRLTVGVPADQASVLDAVLRECLPQQDDLLGAAEALEVMLRASEQRGAPLRLRVVDCGGDWQQDQRGVRETLQAVLDRPAVRGHLQELRVQQHLHGDMLLGAAAGWVSALKCLRVLRLCAPDMSHESVQALAAALRGDGVVLEELDVSDSEGGLPLPALCEAVAHSTTIESLRLDGYTAGEYEDSEDEDAYYETVEAPLRGLLGQGAALRKLGLRDEDNAAKHSRNEDGVYLYEDDDCEVMGWESEPEVDDFDIARRYRRVLSALGAGLATTTSLSELTLAFSSSKVLLPSDVEAFCDGLAQNSTLRVLDLKEVVPFPANGIGKLATALRSCRVERLRMVVDVLDEPFGAIGDALMDASSIRELDLIQADRSPYKPVDLETNGMRKLAQAIREGALGRTLETLKLAYAKVPAECTEALCDGLASSTALRSVDIRYEKTGGGRDGDALGAFGKVLGASRSLRRLRLATWFTQGAVAEIAKGLRENTVLQHLELHCEGVWSMGAVPLADALGAHSALRCLRLTEPFFYAMFAPEQREETTQEVAAMAKALAGALDRGAPLEVLDIMTSRVYFGADVLKELLAAAMRSSCPAVFDVSVTADGRDGDALAAWLEEQWCGADAESVERRKVRFKPRLLQQVFIY
ncbi:unnamed protein product [Pedinophyceae sp. YPF-701]|nr:unnamed protein product [Pedinophyceae sp. YPF-701]